MSADLYAELGLDRNATPDEIKAAHRKMAKLHHPDAGGDPADFDRIQSAALVLRDPDRRDHYDRTGETDAGQDHKLQGALGLIRQAFEHMIQSGDPEHQDIIDLTRAILVESSKQKSSERAGMQLKLAKAKRRRKQLRHKGTRANLLGNMIDENIRSIEGEIRSLDKAIEAHGLADDLLDDYEWEFTEREPQFSAQWTMSSTSNG